MKIKVVIDKNLDEDVVVYARERNELVDKIESLLKEDNNIVAKKDRTLYNLNLAEIVCFTAENNKVFAHAGKERFETYEKIYELEENLPDNFLKINKSCIANIDKIKSFDATITGTLAVNFKNGYRDFVSRRRMKSVKERLLRK